jgi:uncharacterized iron-regulated membrane protein
MGRAGATGFQNQVYNAVWRWHFIAGLLALPFLLNLAVTGAIYLFHTEIDAILYRAFETVPLREEPVLPASALVDAAQNETGGKALQLTLASEPSRAVTVTIEAPSGERQTAYLDPYDGTLLGTVQRGGVMAVVRKLHSLEYFGFFANCLVEIAAGWVVVLVLSGLYLWWPRAQQGGIVTIRATPRSRLFWRDLHAVTGLFASGVILFLAVTGMPWSPIWGRTVQQWTTAAGLGRPTPPVETSPRGKGPAGADRQAAGGHDHGAPPAAALPWALERAAPPESRPSAPKATAIGLDAAIEAMTARGLEKPFAVALPVGPKGAYVGTARPPQVERTRTLYVDQFDGKILADVGFADYGPAAKAIEWGISTHQGEQYGTLNRILMLAGCIALVLLVISAPVMWWKRRPKRSLGLPAPATDRRAAVGVLAIIMIGGLLFPLVGATILAALACEGLGILVRRLTAPREVPSLP